MALMMSLRFGGLSCRSGELPQGYLSEIIVDMPLKAANLSPSLPSSKSPEHVVSLLGQKSCRTKVPLILRVFVPDFLPSFPPNFPRNFQKHFVLCLPGNADHKKSTKKTPAFFNAKSSGKNREIYSQVVLERRQSKHCHCSVVRHPGEGVSQKSQRAPKGLPNEDPPKSRLRVSVCTFSFFRPMKQLFGRQRPLPKTCVFPLE